MKTYIENITVGCIVLLLSILMYHLSIVQIADISLTGLHPRTIPYMVSRGVMILSIAMIGKGGIQYLKEKKQNKFTKSKTKINKFSLFIFSLMVVYGIAMTYLGYFISSFTVLSSMLFILKERNIKNYIILNSLVIVVYFVIEILLKIRLPRFILF